MGREPGDPTGAGLPPAGQERCHSLFAAPWALGGPQGASGAAEDSAYQPASLIPLSRAARVSWAHPPVTFQGAPAQGGASGGGTTQLAPGGSARPHIAMAKPGHCFQCRELGLMVCGPRCRKLRRFQTPKTRPFCAGPGLREQKGGASRGPRATLSPRSAPPSRWTPVRTAGVTAGRCAGRPRPVCRALCAGRPGSVCRPALQRTEALGALVQWGHLGPRIARHRWRKSA